MSKTTGRLLAVLLAVFALVLAGCSSDDDSNGDTGSAPEGPTIKVRGQDFTESKSIAEVYGQYLQGLGYDVEILTAAGFRAEAVQGIETAELDLIIDYIGGSQTELVPDAAPSQDADEVIEVITPAYAEIGATVLEYSPAIDGDAYVVRGDLDATTISETADLGLRLGASSQCFERPQCYIGLTDPEVYGIEFSGETTIEFGSTLGDALAAEEVDVVIWNTTAPQIDAQGFKILEDDQGLFPAQNIAPIVRTEVLDAYGDQLTEDLNTLSAQITTEDLIEWNIATDIDFRESDDVAAEWLEAKGLA
jgi:osmoprotectant transport system substrate-binding protein